MPLEDASENARVISKQKKRIVYQVSVRSTIIFTKYFSNFLLKIKLLKHSVEITGILFHTFLAKIS